jgi:hypothetical protein
MPSTSSVLSWRKLWLRLPRRVRWPTLPTSLRDDEGNSVAHILHNMSFNVDVIARNTDAVAVVLTDADARDSLAQTVAIYGS